MHTSLARSDISTPKQRSSSSVTSPQNEIQYCLTNLEDILFMTLIRALRMLPAEMTESHAKHPAPICLLRLLS